MGFKHFSIQIIIRLIILFVIITIDAFLIAYTEYIKALFVFPVIIILIYELFRYLNKSNEDYVGFLNALSHQDYTIHFKQDDKGKSFNNLYENFERISNQFRSLNFDRELQFQHLQKLVKHIDIGMVSFDENNEIHLINDALRDLLKLSFVEKGHNISKLPESFYSMIRDLKPGANQIYKEERKNQIVEFSLSTSAYDYKNHSYTLISVKDIHGELDVKEQESFQKLISVLTHEIMNSVSPIVSLSSTLNDEAKSLNDNDKTTSNIKNGLQAIHDRSKSLLEFTQEYRKLTKLPKAVIEEFALEEFYNSLETLYKEEFEKHNIAFSIKISEKTEHIKADKHLLEQLLINLLKNAIEAIQYTKNPEILINTFVTQEQQLCIELKDNGKGMTTEELTKIFIPFYTTKQSGSGIGLSLCKQIMKLHRGRIYVDSELEEYTIVRLIFPI